MFIQEKNLIAWSFYNPNNPSEIIDILIHKDLADMNTDKRNEIYKVLFGLK